LVKGNINPEIQNQVFWRNRKNSNIHQYNIGDVVRVRSKENISKTLDTIDKLDGCLFMEQMWEYCDSKFKVIKVVNNFFDEHKYKMFKTLSPLYILDGLICDGNVDTFDHRCDHSCYFLWHEKWLEKA